MISKDLLKSIPDKPGVYIMYSSEGEVIYIGKSINLRNRVNSYFSSKNHTKRIQNLINRVEKIDYIVTSNEAEALILEATLIKRHKPRYNILMKDSKFFPFIKLSKDEFPYINATRKYIPNENVEYFGPYVDSELPYKIVDLIQRTFRLRTCKKLPKKACLNYYISRCSAPCIKKITKEEYQKDVENVKLLLNGKVNEVIERLQKEMIEESKKLNFEKAATIRDNINTLRTLKNQEQYIFQKEDINAIYISTSTFNEFVNYYLIYIINGKFFGKESVTLNTNEEESTLERFLSDVFLSIDNNLLVKKIIAPSEIIEGIKSFFSKLSGNFNHFKDIEIILPQDEKDLKILDNAKKNSKIILNEHISKIDISEKEEEELRSLIKVEKEISIIDGFDIANYGNEIAVGSSVRFIDGKPYKKGYKIFRINTVIGQNDFAMIEETVFRRYSKKEDKLPDLILIDGGLGQLNSAIKSLKKLNLEIPIISLAKEEEKIILPSRKELKLPINSYALRLLQRVRDEAHRFGNNFIKNVKSKTLKSKKLKK
ncbi:MAG: excinuclease ABC subunit UvrC [Brevinematia bacterium]